MQNKEFHYRYAISYLISIIILIVALAYYKVPDLVDKFSFALTLSSLLLAVLAIFYTIISAHKQDSQFSKIIEASSKLGNSVIDIDKAASKIALMTEDIPEHFKRMNSKIDNISNTYKALNESEKVKDVAVNEEQKPTDKNIGSMFTRLQFNGMAVLYLFVVASRKSTPIEYDFFDDFELAGVDYAIGLLNGFEVTGLIDFKLYKKSIIPTHCDNILYEKIKKELDLIVSVVNKESSKDLSDAMSFIDKKYA